jgi:branched-chain amino acid transport system substrate-binding protein
MFRKFKCMICSMVVVILLSFFLVSNGTGAETPGVTKDQILVGSYLALTGPAASVGLNLKYGMQAYFEYINEQGGIHGRKIKIIVEDDQYSPALTVAAVKKMVERDEVFALVGALGTGPTMAVKDYLVRKGVPLVAPSTTAIGAFYPPQRNIFGVIPTDKVCPVVCAQYAMDKLGLKRLAIIYQNDDLGKNGLLGAKAAVESRGLKLVAEEAVDLASTDFSSQVTKVKMANPDGVIIWVMLTKNISITKEIRKQGLNVQLLDGTAMSDPRLASLGGKEAEGYIGEAVYYTDNFDIPSINLYKEQMKKHFPDQPIGGYTLMGWAEALIFCEGLKLTGPNLTRDNFIKAMEGMKDYETGLWPPITFGPNNREGSKAVLFTQVKDGKIVPISDWVFAKPTAK